MPPAKTTRTPRGKDKEPKPVKQIHDKGIIELAPDFQIKKSWPERLHPDQVRILEHGKMQPLIWDKSDEMATKKGFLFSPQRAAHFRDVIHGYFTLWEGEYNGQPARLEDDWQWPCLSRIFGWVSFSKKWNRWIRRYRNADIWVPKKNKKSPTAAFVGIYMWAFDGEPGNQIYSVARDGKQAMRVHQHVINMVRASKMMKDVKINKTTGQLLHVPSLSVYSVMHGDNVESQEGLNGSFVMDEVHVIVQKLANVLRGMGASRSEPLNFRVSTVGSDPVSYGRGRYEYGKQVSEGGTKDVRTFFKSYEAPQDASDEQLSNPKIWEMANPCWNRTIDPVEFAQEFMECKRTSTDFTNFKQRRLNIWQKSDNPWINVHDWNACERRFDPFDPAQPFLNKVCSGGADLSKTRDLTSITLAWEIDQPSPNPSLIHIWTHFWIPEVKANQYKDQVPFRDWAKAGWVTITPGRVLDETRIKNDIGDIFKKFKIRIFNYDPLFASNLISKLQADGYQDCEFTEFKQTLWHFTKPTIRCEKLVTERRLVHDGNVCLTWQFGHARLKTRDDYVKPVKPESPGLFRSVDGVQSSLMAIAGLELLPRDIDYSKLDVVVLGDAGSYDVF